MSESSAEASAVYINTRSSEIISKAVDHLLEGCMVLGFDWTYLYVNEAAARHGQQKPENLIGRTMLEMYPGVENSNVFRHYRIAMEKRVPQYFESDYTFEDGTTTWFEFRVEPILEGIFILSLDITDRKRAQEALTTAHEFSRGLIESMQDGFVILDKHGRTLDANPAFCKMTGLSREELIGKAAPFAYWPPEERENIFAAFKKTLKGEFHHFELVFMRKDGERFSVIVSPSFIRDKTGNIINYTATIKDVTEQKKAIEALQRSESWLRNIFENTNTCIAATDANGNVTDFNESFQSLLGFDEATLYSKNFAEFTHPDDLKEEMVYFDEILAGKRDGYRMIKRYYNSKHQIIWINLSTAVIRDKDGKVVNFVAVIHDITDQKAAEDKIEFLAYHDALTELPNRVLAKDHFSLATSFANRAGTKLALIFLDLDNFKTINDTLGHPVGDELLKAISMRLRACIRDTDTLSRQGGDEFLIFLSDVREQESISHTAEKILDKISAPIEFHGQQLSTSSSIGIAIYPDDGKDFDTLLKRADAAMYQAKSAGRNTYRYYTEQMNIDAMESLRIRNSLHRALDNREFILHYQPQFDVTSGNVIGAEALIRWDHPELGIVPPARFVPLAEENGMIVQIGEWVLLEACRQAVAWRKLGLREMTIAVNISAAQFRHRSLENSVMQALTDSGLDPARLELELTETILIHDVATVLSALQRLKALGVKLSIDDFGTGYSSLSYLKRLKVDKLKIDQSFVRDMAVEPNDAEIVRAICQMAKSLNLRTIAEGVEDEHALSILRLYQCDDAQGYYFAKPMPSNEFIKYCLLRS